MKIKIHHLQGNYMVFSVKNNSEAINVYLRESSIWNEYNANMYVTGFELL